MVRLFRSIPQRQGMTLGSPITSPTPILTITPDKPPHRRIRRHTRKARPLCPRDPLSNTQSRTRDLRNRHQAKLSRPQLHNLRRNNDANRTSSRSRHRLHGNLRRQLRRPKDDGLRQSQSGSTRIVTHRSARSLLPRVLEGGATAPS